MSNASVLEEKTLTTADFAAAGQRPAQREAATGEALETRDAAVPPDGQWAALFTPEVASDFRSRWDAVQKADELVAQVMKNLAESFAGERARFEAQVGAADGGSTEDMRAALRRYRSFFQRLLTL